MHQPAATLNWAIGEYVMESVIRAGGRATVYAARRHGVEGLRALKVIAIGSGSDARAVADAERRGAELQQAFARHNGLVPWVEEIGETRNCLYVAMELVPGEDLFDILARGPLAPAHALEIAIELATFLERAHGFETPGGAGRIIHADLKPGNVRVRPDGHIRVLDFGIAKAMAEQRLVTTQKWGTRQYMSPEWLQTGTIDEQVDYWSLGVLLYEMVAGYRPFRRFERHDNQLEDAIRRGERPEALAPTIDLAIQRVLWRLLAPAVHQRYAKAAEIRAALEACRRGAPVLPAGLTAGATFREDIPTERVPAPASSVTPGSASTIEDSPATEPVPDPSRFGAIAAASPLPMPAQMSAATPAPWDTPPTERVPPALRADVPTQPVSLQIDSPPTEPVPAAFAAATFTADGSAIVPPPLPSSATPIASPSDDVAALRRPLTRRQQLRKYAITTFGVLLTMFLMSEGMSCVAAEHLRADAATADEQQLDAIVKRRMRLSGLAVHMRADPVLKGRLVSLADGVITNYRQEQPTVTRADWEHARAWLTQAFGLYPEDDRLQSKLRYTEGQLQRLAGLLRADSNSQSKTARQSYYAAIQKFQEAAALDPKSPDPYLGLTQTYIYGLGDVDAALDAQQAAEKRGYRLNRRERAALGDGYRARGERTWRGARDLKGDQQRDAYERAQKDFKNCVETFGPIVEFANAADQLHRCEARLAELDNRNTPWWERIFGKPKFELHFGDSEPSTTEQPR